MSVFYTLDGTISLRLGADVDLAIERIRKCVGGEEQIDVQVEEIDDHQTVKFDDGTYDSPVRIDNVLDVIEALSPFVLEPTCIDVSIEDRRPFFLYVGPDDREVETRSAHALVKFLAKDFTVLTQSDLLDYVVAVAAGLDADHLEKLHDGLQAVNRK